MQFENNEQDTNEKKRKDLFCSIYKEIEREKMLKLKFYFYLLECNSIQIIFYFMTIKFVSIF